MIYTLTTGIAWHRDQDGNTAADITGNSERWMLSNLAAKTYASNTNNPHAT